MLVWYYIQVIPLFYAVPLFVTYKVILLCMFFYTKLINKQHNSMLFANSRVNGRVSAPVGMAWRGCGAAAPGSLSACVLHPFPFPEMSRSFPAGFPRGGLPVPRGSVLSAPMGHDMYISSSEAPPISRPPSGLWGASGSVRCRLGWFGSCVLSALGVSLLRVVGGAAPRRAHGLRVPLPVCGREMADWMPSSKVWAALGLRSPGRSGMETDAARSRRTAAAGRGRGEAPH